jgi:hypothetical protein
LKCKKEIEWGEKNKGKDRGNQAKGNRKILKTQQVKNNKNN